MNRNVMFAFVTVCCLLSGLCSVAVAQQPATGLPSLGSFAGGPFDTINLSNLDVHFAIPVFSRPGRGIPFTYTLTYDSLVWMPVTSGTTTSWQPVDSNWGWRSITSAATGYVSYGIVNSNGSCPYQSGGVQLDGAWTIQYGQLAYHDAVGGVHPFVGTIVVYTVQTGAPPQCGTSYMNPVTLATTTDNSGYTVSTNATTALGPATVYTSDGRKITTPNVGSLTGAGVVADANGNQINISATGVITDTLGTALTITGTPASGTVQYEYTAPGATATVQVTYAHKQVQTCFNYSHITDFPATWEYLPTQVVLPDGSDYQFTYEATTSAGSCTAQSGAVTGQLASITLPTGGAITYGYGQTGCGNANDCILADGTPAQLARTVGGGTWVYNHGVQSGYSFPQTSTTVTDPAGNQTALNFSGIYETSRQVYQGSTTGGTRLNYTYTCYNWNSGTACLNAAVSTPIEWRAVQNALDTDPTSGSAVWSGIQYTYDCNANPSKCYGLVTEEDDYDFGTSSGHNLLRKIKTSYNTSLCGSPTYICGRPSGVQVYDSANNETSLTSYYYDANGNPSEISRWLTGANYLNHFSNYNNNGTLHTTTDVNGAITTYSYNSGVCNSAFPTSISTPGDNGTNIAYNYTYNCGGGVALTVTDPNGHVSGASYTRDHYFWRPESVTDNDGSVTNYNYYGQNNTGSSVVTVPGQAESILTNSTSSVTDTLTTVDNLGRPYLQQLREGPSSGNWDTSEVLYDTSGYSSWVVSSPVVAGPGAGPSGVPATNYRYDGMGRVTDIDSSYWGGVDTHYAYYRNDVTVSTPAQARQYAYNALAELTAVCEILGSGGAACGSMTGSGYLTTYSYDTLGNLTGVSQDANQTPQSRSYLYDRVSRMTKEINPESGTVNYQYDSDTGCGSTSSGDLIKKVDNAGNTTCLYYDGLHRVTSAGGSVCRRYVYDAATVNGITMLNAIGRLAEAKTDNCAGGLFTDEGFGYSPRGENTYFYEKTPNSGGYYEVYQGYSPNGALNILNTVFAGITMTYGLDGEGRISTVSSSTGATLVSATNFNYQPSGATFNMITPISSITYGSGDSDSFTYDTMFRRLQGAYNVGTKSVTNTYYWNSDSTLQKLDVVDGLSHPTGYAISENCDTIQYDNLGRLITTTCTGAGNWAQTFTYDAYGNIQQFGRSIWNQSYSASTNQIVGYSYDLNGNLNNDGANAYTWDTWGNASSVGGKSLVYDAFGRMVENTTAGQEFVYTGRGTQVLAKMSGQTVSSIQYPLPGGATAIYSGTDFTYARADLLGSVRLVTDKNKNWLTESGYAPFGQQYNSETNNGGSSFYDFTGQQQWSVSAGADFPFRKYSSAQGRWVSPDPAGMAAVDITNPQTWNRYAYVMNNPLSFIDPLGLIDCLVNPDGSPMNGGCGGDYGAIGTWGDSTFMWANDIYQVAVPDYDSPEEIPAGYMIYTIYPFSNLFGLPMGVNGTDPSNEPPPPCQAKVLNATNNQFGTNYTDANVSSTFNYSTGAGPGQGTLNLNITGSTAGVSPGYYPLHWWTYFIGYGSTLHAVSGPGGIGGLDSTMTVPFGPNQATFHIDSGYPYNPVGAFFHWLLNMTKAGGYPKC